MEALLTTFLVSHLDSECNDNLFDNYQAWYVLVNVESPLMQDIAVIQSFYQERDGFAIRSSLYAKYDNVRYFFERTRTQKVREAMTDHNVDNLQS